MFLPVVIFRADRRSLALSTVSSEHSTNFIIQAVLHDALEDTAMLQA